MGQTFVCCRTLFAAFLLYQKRVDNANKMRMLQSLLSGCIYVCANDGPKFGLMHTSPIMAFTSESGGGFRLIFRLSSAQPDCLIRAKFLAGFMANFLKSCVMNHTKWVESRFHAAFCVIRVQGFCMNISKNFAPAFPAWCATLEKLRLDYGLNCKKRLKRAVFCN